MAYKKANGQRVGSVPYGKRLADNGMDLIDDAAEQEIIRLVRGLRHNGFTLAAIAAELDKRGFKPRGTKWHAQTIKNIITAAA
jgi:hypothetical protein